MCLGLSGRHAAVAETQNISASNIGHAVVLLVVAALISKLSSSAKGVAKYPKAGMATPTSVAFAPVTLSRAQAARLESMMQQQVQDAVLARAAQRMKDDKLDSDWRFVSSLGQLKTFKTRGTDSFTSTSSWNTTLERACNVNDRISTGANTWTMRSRSSGRSRNGRLSFSRCTVGATVGRRDPLDPRPPIQSYRTFGRVQGNYRDIVDAHYAATSADFVQQQKLLSPVVTDGAVLHTIRATKDSYLGIKWLAENSFAGKHDSCFVEMVGYTINTSGQEIGFVAMASVDIPECPEFTESMKLARVRMKRTTLVIPAVDTPKATSEIFVMGASEANVSSIIMHAQYRLNMAVLNDISLVIDSQNIANQTLALQKNWVPNASRPSCSICSRKFHFMYRRRHHCRLCGDIVCKSCFVTRAVPGANIENGSGCKPDAAVISQTKFCVRCVMGLRSIDKRLDKYSQQISKMLSLNMDKLNAPTTAVMQPPSEANQSDLAVSTSDEKGVLDMDDVYHIPGAKYLGPTEVDMDDDDTDSTSVRSIDAVPTVAYEASECKYLQPSLSVHSQSHNKLPGLSQLNRHSSTVSLGSEPDIFEEKVILNMDKLSRIVAI